MDCCHYRFRPFILLAFLIGNSSCFGIGSPESSIPFNAERAMSYLEKICELGPRVSGSSGMKAQWDLLENHFDQFPRAQILWQTFEYRHPITGKPVPMKNLVVRWNANEERRFLLCAHYDTRPFPDKDLVNKKGKFVGANDGASGPAFFMEFAHHIELLPSNLGIDLILFDGEELVYDEARDPYFLGSTYFARAYAENSDMPRYEAGVLIDLIADKNLQIYYETNSLKFAENTAKEIWGVASKIGVKEFIPTSKYTIRDDHLPLFNIGGIPTVDLIDFDYPGDSEILEKSSPGRSRANAPKQRNLNYWHTTQDTPDKCSGESMKKVGIVIAEWLKSKAP